MAKFCATNQSNKNHYSPFQGQSARDGVVDGRRAHRGQTVVHPRERRAGGRVAGNSARGGGAGADQAPHEHHHVPAGVPGVPCRRVLHPAAREHQAGPAARHRAHHDLHDFARGLRDAAILFFGARLHAGAAALGHRVAARLHREQGARFDVRVRLHEQQRQRPLLAQPAERRRICLRHVSQAGALSPGENDPIAFFGLYSNSRMMTIF